MSVPVTWPSKIVSLESGVESFSGKGIILTFTPLPQVFTERTYTPFPFSSGRGLGHVPEGGREGARAPVISSRTVSLKKPSYQEVQGSPTGWLALLVRTLPRYAKFGGLILVSVVRARTRSNE